jgi:hypothetical protein
MLIVKVVERLLARKEAAQKTDVQRFYVKKLSEMEVRRQFQIELSDKFVALQNLRHSEDINKARENIKGNITISAKKPVGLSERKQHVQKCSQFLSQRKQAKIQWLQNPNQSNLDNVNNTRREASRYFRKNERIFESQNL